MTDLLTPREVMDEMVRLSQLLDDALSYAKRAAHEYAEADDAYRVAHAKAFVTAKDGGATDAMAKARADLATEGIRSRARLAEAMNKTAVEAIRSRRTQVSALQTAGNALRAELEIARYGPEAAA